ncbi:septal ring lytic transglycosylase RlpA family protein [Desulfovibrio ferrophilus]|uniref:Probable endolytic peptidoglycan transglycosylase RlpA n=1 Tax=Desulfovibrio ferrophilus TaxID=241368 RepID=A0A2Z6B231_9BACT|nr:septal ring lytic transglycosylase RlpA family protein [Desulfovibrio ferrophilus]BBD09498.1 Rare lipoprotein A [Desulfovibrio ferrophilus]
MGQTTTAFRLTTAAMLIAALMLTLSGCGKRQIPTSQDPARRPSVAAPAPGKAGPVPKGTFKPYTIAGKRYYPLSSSDGYVQTGIASWYGDDFHGKKTANGETYDMYAMTCAHKVLPMNTYVRITNRNNGKVVTLRVNDRGPFVGSRIVDLSHAGAQALGVIGPGTAPVRLEAVGVAGRQAPSIAKAVADGSYFVQVGSFTQPENAKRLLATLKQSGYSGSRMKRALISGQSYWRVQAGVFRGMDHANKVHAALKHKYPASFLIAD